MNQNKTQKSELTPKLLSKIYIGPDGTVVVTDLWEEISPLIDALEGEDQP